MVSPAAVRPSPSDATDFYLLFAHVTNFASSLAHLLPGITLLPASVRTALVVSLSGLIFRFISVLQSFIFVRLPR